MKQGDDERPLTSKEAEEAVRKYTFEIETRIKPDLELACNRRDKVFDKLIELEQMEKALDLIEESGKEKNKQQARIPTDDQTAALETKVNIGEEFYVRANVYDLEKIIVDIGCGVLVEMSFEEARDFIYKQRKVLEKQSEVYSDRVVQIETHLKAIIKCLSDLKNASSTTNNLNGEALPQL